MRNFIKHLKETLCNRLQHTTPFLYNMYNMNNNYR